MFALDHVAVQTNDIAETAKFYVQEFGAEILYQDDSWAFLRLGQGKLALVNPKQHPAHVALRTTQEELETSAKHFGKTIKTHRDGTTGIYLEDPAGNQVELICYPVTRQGGETG
ncbi:MAG TPA: VOC family protein [Phycisphaerae bacterium]|nr:VOC family protein [Phycisphaerae bacterium]